MPRNLRQGFWLCARVRDYRLARTMSLIETAEITGELPAEERIRLL